MCVLIGTEKTEELEMEQKPDPLVSSKAVSNINFVGHSTLIE